MPKKTEVQSAADEKSTNTETATKQAQKPQSKQSSDAPGNSNKDVRLENGTMTKNGSHKNGVNGSAKNGKHTKEEIFPPETIVKRDGRYRHDPSEAPLKPSVRIFPAPPNLLILKTQPGFAQAVGAVLDDKPLTAQVGTVAGDDTVMVVLGDPSRMDAAIEEGRRRFGAVVVSATS